MNGINTVTDSVVTSPANESSDAFNKGNFLLCLLCVCFEINKLYS